MPKYKSFQVSDLIERQLDKLERSTGMNRSEIIRLAIDRMAREEIKMFEKFVTLSCGHDVKYAEWGGPGQEDYPTIGRMVWCEKCQTEQPIDQIETRFFNDSYFYRYEKILRTGLNSKTDVLIVDPKTRLIVAQFQFYPGQDHRGRHFTDLVGSLLPEKGSGYHRVATAEDLALEGVGPEL